MRKSFSPEFMAKVAVAALKEDMMMAVLSSQYEDHSAIKEDLAGG